LDEGNNKCIGHFGEEVTDKETVVKQNKIWRRVLKFIL
jgi:hypothetical protein